MVPCPRPLVLALNKTQVMMKAILHPLKRFLSETRVPSLGKLLEVATQPGWSATNAGR